MGYLPYQLHLPYELVQDFFHQHYRCVFTVSFIIFCINYNCEKISQQHPSKHAAFHPTQPLELSGSCKIHVESHHLQIPVTKLVLATPCKASLLSTSYRLNMQFLKVISKNPTRKSISWNLFQESGSKPSWLEVYYLYIPPGDRDHHDHHYMFIYSFTNVLPRFWALGIPRIQ